jgi:hypothetical protein
MLTTTTIVWIGGHATWIINILPSSSLLRAHVAFMVWLRHQFSSIYRHTLSLHIGVVVLFELMHVWGFGFRLYVSLRLGVGLGLSMFYLRSSRRIFRWEVAVRTFRLFPSHLRLLRRKLDFTDVDVCFLRDSLNFLRLDFGSIERLLPWNIYFPIAHVNTGLTDMNLRVRVRIIVSCRDRPSLHGGWNVKSRITGNSNGRDVIVAELRLKLYDRRG